MIIITTYHYSILYQCIPHLSYKNYHNSIVQVHLRYNHHQNNYARIKSRSILRRFCASMALQLSLNLRALLYKLSLSFTGFCFCMTTMQSASIKSLKLFFTFLQNWLFHSNPLTQKKREFNKMLSTVLNKTWWINDSFNIYIVT